MKNGCRPFKGKNLKEKAKDYTVIDLETTGRYVNSCEIIELSAVKIREGNIINEYSSLVRPNETIPPEITEITGITAEMLIGAPPIQDVIQDFLDFIGNDIVIGHNIVAFDCNIIYDLCESLNLKPFCNDMIDTYHFARKCDVSVPNYKLTTLAEYFGYDYEAHRSLNDCIAAFKCYEKLKPLYIKNAPSKSSPSHKIKYSEDTKALQTLNGIITGIICDGVLSDNEILFLKNWISQNSGLAGNFPYDIINETLQNILADKVVTEDERFFLLNLLTDYSDTVNTYSEDYIDILSLKGKRIVLTGNFINGPKEDVALLLESRGAEVCKSVSGKTDYLIVGGCGNENWACGKYGTKVKKAIELQKKGQNIKIIKEEELFKCLKETVLPI